MKVYLIAELGINHNGEIQTAKRLIDCAFASQWDAVKFQKRNPEVCVPEHQKNVMRVTPWGEMTYLEYRYRVEFNGSEYNLLDRYCKTKPIEWSASVWDLDSLKFIMRYDPPWIKIPSAKLTDLELIKEACKSDKLIIVSTGMSTMEDIHKAVNILDKYAKDFILMHTNSTYPSPVNDLNLKMINTLKKEFSCKIGYSGHEYSLTPSVVAVMLGAEYIERHITLDHRMWGTDQSSSLEVSAMDTLKRRIDEAVLSLGNGVKKITKEEEEILRKLRG